MTKIFVAIALLLALGVPGAFANHIPMPNLPIGETAYKIKNYHEKCGEVIVYQYYAQNGFWAVYTLDSKWLAVILYDKEGLPEKAWLLRNLDGHISERLDSLGEILIKYPYICDIAAAQ